MNVIHRPVRERLQNIAFRDLIAVREICNGTGNAKHARMRSGAHARPIHPPLEKLDRHLRHPSVRQQLIHGKRSIPARFPAGSVKLPFTRNAHLFTKLT